MFYDLIKPHEILNSANFHHENLNIIKNIAIWKCEWEKHKKSIKNFPDFSYKFFSAHNNQKTYMCIKFPITYETTLRDVKKLYRKIHLYKKKNKLHRCITFFFFAWDKEVTNSKLLMLLWPEAINLP